MASLNVVRQAFKNFVEDGRFLRVLDKVMITGAEDGKLTAELVVDHEHTNAMGSLQGGLTTTLVDALSSLALLSVKTEDDSVIAGVSVNLNVTFFSPAMIGETVLIEASTLRSGKNVAFLSVDLMEKYSKRMIARGQHIHYNTYHGPMENVLI